LAQFYTQSVKSAPNRSRVRPLFRYMPLSDMHKKT
jgi:hypothetical protein